MKIKNVINSRLPFVWKSKVGHITFVFPFFRKRVKIYQAANPTHAVFLKTTLNHPDLSIYFHPILFSFSKYLFAEWVEGVSCDAIADKEKYRAIDWIVDLQTRLHTLRLCDKDERTGFEYLDYLEKRLVKFAPPNIDLAEIRRLRLIASSPPVKECFLSHPDVTLRNIVIEKSTGNFKLIDNELLTQSSYFFLDIFNTCYSLYPSSELICYYLDKYSACQTRFSMQTGWASSLAAAWSLRIAGSHFQAGKYEEGFEDLNHWAERNEEIIRLIGNKHAIHKDAFHT